MTAIDNQLAAIAEKNAPLAAALDTIRQNVTELIQLAYDATEERTATRKAEVYASLQKLRANTNEVSSRLYI